ncbi:MAG: hypothetical protein ACTXOO_05075 [Sodalis sp. (in: enterobacteria)]
MLLEGVMRKHTCLACVEQALLPALVLGNIMINNFVTYKVDSVREVIKAKGIPLLYLLLYSPNLNPIEMAILKPKSLLRKTVEKTVDWLLNSIAQAIKLVFSEI